MLNISCPQIQQCLSKNDISDLSTLHISILCNVLYNMASHGMTNTELIANIPEKVRLLTATQTPLRHIATPEDIAEAIIFLASDKSDFLVGETIRVNGGQIMI